MAHLNEYQQRVVDEKTELDKKKDKLGEFIKGSTYKELPWEDRRLLGLQLSHMALYSDTLRNRIDRFKTS